MQNLALALCSNRTTICLSMFDHHLKSKFSNLLWFATQDCCQYRNLTQRWLAIRAIKAILSTTQYVVERDIARKVMITCQYHRSCQIFSKLASCWPLFDPSVTPYIVAPNLVTQAVDVFSYHRFGLICDIVSNSQVFETRAILNI